MNTQHSFTLLINLPQPATNDLILQRALESPVWILDAGNCFNPYQIVRQIRSKTPQVETVLRRILVARAFTCFQVVSLLEQTQINFGSIFILQLLTTFADEMIKINDRMRLLKQVGAQIERLRQFVPLTITLNTTRFTGDPVMGWVSRLQTRADQILLPEYVAESPTPTLF
jgi:hypothetical protein